MVKNNRRARKYCMPFILIIGLIGFMNVFSISGFATQWALIDICTWGSMLLFVGEFFTNKKENLLLPKYVTGILGLAVLLIGLTMFMNYQKIEQLTNMVTLFGIVMWIQLLSKLHWEFCDFKIIGLVSLLFGMCITYNFLPGHVLAGWNSNSSIVAIPIVLFGCVALWLTGEKWMRIIVLLACCLLFSIAQGLNNRSSQLIILLFLLLLLFPFPVYKKKWFRLFYLFVIVFNVIWPLLYEDLLQMPVVKDFFDVGTVISGKDAGLNGRESVWKICRMYISDSPLLGHAGLRYIYSHNFSLDVLGQFGWMGWIVYILSLICIFERVFQEGSPYNLYLVAFICFLLMNTFENMMVSNEGFTIFSYILLAIPFYLNKKMYSNNYLLIDKRFSC